MSIFGIILVSLLCACGAALIGILIAMTVNSEDSDIIRVAIIVAFVVFILSIFIGIGINTEYARVWSANFEAQKTTIEQSLDSEVLAGLERIELVNKAAELNGELAERRASSELWHYVYYDEDIYSGIEPIIIN